MNNGDLGVIVGIAILIFLLVIASLILIVDTVEDWGVEYVNKIHSDNRHVVNNHISES